MYVVSRLPQQKIVGTPTLVAQPDSLEALSYGSVCSKCCYKTVMVNQVSLESSISLYVFQLYEA